MRLKRIKENNQGLGIIIMALLVVIVIIVVGFGALFVLYSTGNQYSGCDFTKGTNSENAKGVINSNIVVTAHYNIASSTNSIQIIMPGEWNNNISSSMVSQYKTSFWDSLFPKAEVINSNITGVYTISIESLGTIVYTHSGILSYTVVGVNPRPVGDIQATATLPHIFLEKGVYVITVLATLGAEKQTITVNWNC